MYGVLVAPICAEAANQASDPVGGLKVWYPWLSSWNRGSMSRFESGIDSPTDLGILALATLAQPDPKRGTKDYGENN
jgi:hypothetical protein